jgi:hypothetical protein
MPFGRRGKVNLRSFGSWGHLAITTGVFFSEAWNE